MYRLKLIEVLRSSHETQGQQKSHDANNSWSLIINNYSSTSTRKPYAIYGGYTTSSSKTGFFNFGEINTTSAITSLGFANGGGNFLTGTVLIYGVK